MGFREPLGARKISLVDLKKGRQHFQFLKILWRSGSPWALGKSVWLT